MTAKTTWLSGQTASTLLARSHMPQRAHTDARICARTGIYMPPTLQARACRSAGDAGYSL